MQSVDDVESFWLDATPYRLISEMTSSQWTTILPLSDGRLNTCFNAVDRHLRWTWWSRYPSLWFSHHYIQLVIDFSNSNRRPRNLLVCSGAWCNCNGWPSNSYANDPAIVAMLGCARLGAIQSSIWWFCCRGVGKANLMMRERWLSVPVGHERAYCGIQTVAWRGDWSGNSTERHCATRSGTSHTIAGGYWMACRAWRCWICRFQFARWLNILYIRDWANGGVVRDRGMR